MSRKQFLVIGAGRFGAALATTLYDLGHEVVAVDDDEEALDEVADKVTHAAILDATEEEALIKLGVKSFDTVIVAIGEDLEASILATVSAKSAGARHVITKVNTQMAARVLASVGADEVIRPEHDMGLRLAQQLARPTLVDAFDLGADHRVVEIECGRQLQGKLADLELPDRFGVQVIAVHRSGTLHVNPDADFEIEPEDRVVVIGAHDGFERFLEHVED